MAGWPRSTRITFRRSLTVGAPTPLPMVEDCTHLLLSPFLFRTLVFYVIALASLVWSLIVVSVLAEPENRTCGVHEILCGL